MIKHTYTEQAEREKTTCAACGHRKQVGLVVCWSCFKAKPRGAAVEMPGYKYWYGTLHDFVVTAGAR